MMDSIYIDPQTGKILYFDGRWYRMSKVATYPKHKFNKIVNTESKFRSEMKRIFNILTDEFEEISDIDKIDSILEELGIWSEDYYYDGYLHYDEIVTALKEYQKTLSNNDEKKKFAIEQASRFVNTKKDLIELADKIYKFIK